MLTKMFKAAMVFVVGVSFLLAGHGPTAAQAKKLRVAVSLPDMSLAFFPNMARQIQDEAAKLGDIEITVFDGKGQTATQSDGLDQVVEQKFDGLLISPLNADTMVPAIQNVVDSAVPVVTIDRNINSVQTLAHVGGDNVKGGEAQAQLIMTLFPKGARIFNIQGTPGATPAIDRNKGLHNVLDGKPDYRIVFEKTGNFSPDDAKTVVEAALANGEPPDVINCANDGMAMGVLEVLRAKNMTGKIAVIGYDALPEVLLLVKSGEMTATVEQFPGGQSRRALQLLVDYLRNNKKPEAHDNYLPPQVITKDNLTDAERVQEAEALANATPAATMSATENAATSATMSATLAATANATAAP
ncbi:MAG: substrate-binding domain-containing protein [Anaerolineae bacterium]|nr:substrate-binding domain-containing protein [Anaerolineae bacterium]